MKQFVFILFLFLQSTNCHAFKNEVSEDSSWVHKALNITAYYHHGYFFPHTKALTYFTDERINGIQIEARRYFPQLNPARPPEIGLGYYHSNLGSQEVHGKVHGIYMNMGVDYFKGKSPIYLHQTIAAGVSYLTKHFDIHDNSLNRAIGSPFNAFIELSLDLKAEIGDRIILSAGPTYVHMSNGNMKMPNFGLNLLNTRYGLTYRINHDKEEALVIQDNHLTRKNNYLLLTSFGIRQLSRRIPENFLVGAIVTEYSRRINPHQAYGIGLDFVLDPTEGRERYVTGERKDDIVPWHIGAHLSWERIWNNFSIILQPGYKILTLSEHIFYQYNRVGIRYQLDSNIVFNVSIKAQGVRADFFEIGMGYCFH